MKIVSGLLILITVFMGFRHGLGALRIDDHPEQLAMMTRLGIPRGLLLPMSILNIGCALLILFPATFFAGNLINAVLLLLIMALALRAGDVRTALMEIPFLLIPLLLMYLGHPFKERWLMK